MRECSPLDSLSEILTDVPDLVFVYATDGRYLFVNRTAAEFLEADAMDIIGYHWRDLGYPPDVMVPLMEKVEDVAANCKAAHCRLVTSESKGKRTLDMSLTPLKCEDGGVIGVLAIAHDISEFFEK